MIKICKISLNPVKGGDILAKALKIDDALKDITGVKASLNSFADDSTKAEE